MKQIRCGTGLWTALVIGSAWASIAASLWSSANARAAAPEIQAEEFGLELHKGSGFTELVDRPNKRLLRTTYEHSGRIAMQEVLTLGGAYLERFEYRPDAWVHETYTATGTQIEIHRRAGGKLIIQERKRGPGGGWSWHERSIAELSAMSACSFPNPGDGVTESIKTANVNYLFKDYGKDQMPEKAHPDEETYIGYNTVALDCARYPGQGALGAGTVGKDLTAALKTGISCLAKGSAERKADATRLLSLFQGNQSSSEAGGRLRILCNFPENYSRMSVNKTVQSHLGVKVPVDTVLKADTLLGHAFGCPKVWPPAMLLNYALDRQSEPVRASTIFHEMVHWLEKPHENGVKDEAYLSELCCFPKALSTDWTAADTTAACGLLNAPDQDYSRTDNDKFKGLLKKGLNKDNVVSDDKTEKSE